jgi:hypothetical protein
VRLYQFRPPSGQTPRKRRYHALMDRTVESLPPPTLLEQARTLVSRVTKAVGYSAAGAVMGAGLGFFMPRAPKAKKASEQDHVNSRISNVRMMQMFRQLIPAAEGFLREQEYQDRRWLEAKGYYPCSRCGVPHQNGGAEAECDPKGTYEEDGKKVSPSDEAWSVEGYEKATGQKWDPGPLGDDEDDDGGETFH